jgi:hypothetical protein
MLPKSTPSVRESHSTSCRMLWPINVASRGSAARSDTSASYPRPVFYSSFSWQQNTGHTGKLQPKGRMWRETDLQ